METTKLTEEEIKQVTDIQQEFTRGHLTLGQIEWQKIILATRLNELTQQIADIDKKMGELLKELQGKYGIGTLDLSTFEITKTN